MVTVASCASAVLNFNPDNRCKPFFVPGLSEQQMMEDKVKQFLQAWGGAAAVDHFKDIYTISGGNIGILKEVAEDRQAWMAGRQKEALRADRL